MTALVGIMNKRAAVMAADSAVTTTNGGNTKIYNSATKIFNISKAQPMGVMIYSSAEFMDTPWDIIFKLYRDRKGDKEHKTITDFVNGFIDFLRSEDYFCDEEDQQNYFYKELREFYNYINERGSQRLSAIIEEMEKNGEQMDEDKLREEVLIQTIEDFIEDNKDDEPNVEFKNYTLNSMRQYGSKAFDDLMEQCKEDGMPECPRKLWEKGFYTKILSRYYFPISTGLVFVGYGSDDIYPSLMEVTISGVFDRRLRYCIEESSTEVISKKNSACISPFGQDDVMMSLMKGCSTDVHNYIVYTCKEAVVEDTRQKIIEAMREAGASDDMLHKMNELNLSEVEDRFKDAIDKFIRREHIDGVVDAVDSFNIEEMVSMGESLISITNLQRHISSSEESVGGPVDVAVLTRSEGFVWVKHKEWHKQN